MSQAQIITVGDSTALLVSPETLSAIGAKIGDVLEIVVVDRKLVLQPFSETAREQLLRDATEDVLERRASALKKLAE